jgi:glycosyltransferase involved in cell wall biosynthesis
MARALWHRYTSFRMRVSLVTPTFGRDGGVAAHVLSSARALAAGGHTVTVVAGNERDAAAEPDVPASMIVPSLDSLDLQRGMLDVAVSEIRSTAPDILHLHDLNNPILTRSLKRVAPVVSSAHGYPGCAPNTYYFAPGHECTRPNGPLCFAHMAFHGCLHARDRRAMPDLYRLTKRRLEGLRSADAAVAYSKAVLANLHRNDVPKSYLVPLFSTLRQHAGRVDRTTPGLVVFAGRVVAAKGLEVLVRALPAINGTLAVCGDGWALTRIKRLAHKLGVDGKIQFRGWLTESDLDSLLREARVVVVPSVWPEPFGLVGLEAMTRGVPVVGSNTGGIPEWLADGETGFLVEPGEPEVLAAAVNRLLDDEALRAAFGENARKRASARWTAEAHVAALQNVYQRVLEAA